MKKLRCQFLFLACLIGLILTGCYIWFVAPTQPFVVFPLTDATGVATQVVLKWTASEGTSPIKYEVYFGTNPNPDVLIGPVGGVEATSITSPLLLPNTRYHWKVAAINKGGRYVSDTWWFTTLITSTSPSAPVPYSPANGVTALPTPVALYWNASASGTAPIVYDVFLDTNLNPTTKIVDGTNLLMANFSNLLPNTTYYWKVAARNAQGSTASGVWHFTTHQMGTPPSAPLNLAPSNAATSLSLTPLLNWQGSAGTAPVLYDVFLDTAINPTAKVAQDVSDTSFTASTLSGSTTYYWRVEAHNLYGGPITSLTTSFTTQATITDPGTPVNLYPANAASEIPLQVYLVWQQSSGTEPITFDIIFGLTPSTSETIASDVNDTHFPSPILAPNTTYYWRIAAQNAKGMTIGPESSFTTQSSGSAPGMPENLYPAHLATGIPLQVYLVWNPSTGSNPLTYDVYFGSTPSPTTRIGVDVSQTNFPSPVLSADTTYYWYIEAKNAFGTTTGVESSYSTSDGSGDAPSNLVLLSPTNGQTMVPLSTTLLWSCQGTLPITYHIWFGETASLSSPADYKGITTSTAYSVSGLTQGKTYYWKVFATNAYGAGIASSVYSFTTLSTSPAGPIYLEKLSFGNGFQVKSTSYFTPTSPFVMVFESPSINITNMAMVPDFVEKDNFGNFSVIYSLDAAEISSKLASFMPTNLVLFTVISSTAGTIQLNDFVSGIDMQIDPARQSVTLP